MFDISTRINALIAYLFLGPVILLAKKDTPLAEPFVQGHAKRASIIMAIGLLIFIAYRYVRTYLLFSIFGVSMNTVIITLMVTIFLLILLVGAYQAYNSIPAHELSWRSISFPENTIQDGSFSEENKVRIIISFIPFLGIIIAYLYPSNETFIGRKVSTLATFIFLTSIVFFSGTVTTLTFVLTVLYIALIVVTTVQLFAFSKFLHFSFYDRIPSFLELDAHIKATIVVILDFMRIAFGGEKRADYQEKFEYYLQINTQREKPSTPYFMPLWLIAIPGINLITMPSLWQSKYREYTLLILQGLLVSLCMAIIIYIYGSGSHIGLYLLFPIITLIIESKDNILTRAPFTSMVVDLMSLFSRGKDKIAEIKENGEEKIEFKYEVPKKSSSIQ